MSTTIDYYDKNYQNFIENTKNVDFHENQNIFIDLLPDGSCILDVGCGSGRDSKRFMTEGFSILPIDGSKKICEETSRYLGLEVKNILFEDIDFKDQFDGIWACASLLHVPFKNLTSILESLEKSLKRNGIIYLSFKYGDFEGNRNGRYFTDMTENRFNILIQDLSLVILKSWITTDVRENREDEKWLNLILKKV